MAVLADRRRHRAARRCGSPLHRALGPVHLPPRRCPPARAPRRGRGREARQKRRRDLLRGGRRPEGVAARKGVPRALRGSDAGAGVQRARGGPGRRVAPALRAGRHEEEPGVRDRGRAPGARVPDPHEAARRRRRGNLPRLSGRREAPELRLDQGGRRHARPPGAAGHPRARREEAGPARQAAHREGRRAEHGRASCGPRSPPAQPCLRRRLGHRRLPGRGGSRRRGDRPRSGGRPFGGAGVRAADHGGARRGRRPRLPARGDGRDLPRRLGLPRRRDQAEDDRREAFRDGSLPRAWG